MVVTIKKGSVVSIPVYAGWAVTSSAPAVATARMLGTSVSITALAVGPTTLTLALAADLTVELVVTVVS